MKVNLVGIILICFSSIIVWAGGPANLDSWIQSEKRHAEVYLIQNISPRDGVAGSVLASPSRANPDYYYNWVRDAALVMDVFVRDLEDPKPALRRSFVEDLLRNYTNFNAEIQTTNALTGLGEPKFYISGAPYMDNWGRPQNDSPSLRAALLVRFSKYLINTNRRDEARNHVWPVIVNDLNYVAQNALQPSFDLWEEFKGDNYFTLLTERAALLAGADLAAEFGDNNLPVYFRTQVAKIEQGLDRHLNRKKNQIIENQSYETGTVENKSSGLDTATLLGQIHTENYPYISDTEPILQSTVRSLTTSFQNIYSINLKLDLGPAIGRYPEDSYYGGNPWFLTTLAFAEYYYRLGNLNEGDRYLDRVRYHVDERGHMSEQMDRSNGFMLSAVDLSWSYAAFLTAIAARTNLKADLNSQINSHIAKGHAQ